MNAECTFQPRTKGPQPGMRAAQHYLSSNVFDRLTRPAEAPPAGGAGDADADGGGDAALNVTHAVDGGGGGAAAGGFDPLGSNVMDMNEFMSVLQASTVVVTRLPAK